MKTLLLLLILLLLLLSPVWSVDTTKINAGHCEYFTDNIGNVYYEIDMSGVFWFPQRRNHANAVPDSLYPNDSCYIICIDSDLYRICEDEFLEDGYTMNPDSFYSEGTAGLMSYLDTIQVCDTVWCYFEMVSRWYKFEWGDTGEWVENEYMDSVISNIIYRDSIVVRGN